MTSHPSRLRQSRCDVTFKFLMPYVQLVYYLMLMIIITLPSVTTVIFLIHAHTHNLTMYPLLSGTATTTADHIGTAIGIDPKQLDQPCSEDLLLTIARLLPNWMEYADHLKMTPQEINGINTDLDLAYAMKSCELLRMWYRKNAYTDQCHYRVLVEASCDLGYADIAGEICKLIKGE